MRRISLKEFNPKELKTKANKRNLSMKLKFQVMMIRRDFQIGSRIFRCKA
jgi:hypothetical protein